MRCRRCRTASYRSTDAATLTFSELAEPDIGIRTSTSQASRYAWLSPLASFPSTITVGVVKSCRSTSTLADSSAPTS